MRFKAGTEMYRVRNGERYIGWEPYPVKGLAAALRGAGVRAFTDRGVVFIHEGDKGKASAWKEIAP